MTYANVLIAVVAVLIYVMILASCMLNRKNWESYSWAFVRIVIAVALQTLAELRLDVSALIVGKWDYRFAIVFVNTASYVLAIVFSQFLLELCSFAAGEDRVIGKRWVGVVKVIGTLQITAAAVMTLTGVLYGDHDAAVSVPMAVRMVVALWLPVVVMAGDIIMVWRNPVPKTRKITVTVYCLIPAAIIPLYVFAHDIARTPIFLLQVVLLYCNIYTAHEQERSAQKTELEKSRNHLMFSQLEPHFLYNTLNSAIYLCDTDTEKAKETLYDFSSFLRTHMEAIHAKDNVPLEGELDHVRAYLNIEQLRFPDTLKIVYDTRALDIFLPPLTLQPLVENAVKNSVSMKQEGGIIRISSWEDDEYGYIQIEDDGVGFDMKDLEHDKRCGVYKDIQLRLRDESEGRLTVTSHVNEGTRVLIEIPWEKNFIPESAAQEQTECNFLKRLFSWFRAR